MRLSFFREEVVSSWWEGSAGAHRLVPVGIGIIKAASQSPMIDGYFRFALPGGAQPFSKGSWDAYQATTSLRAVISAFCLPWTGRLPNSRSRLVASRLLFLAWFRRFWSHAP